MVWVSSNEVPAYTLGPTGQAGEECAACARRTDGHRRVEVDADVVCGRVHLDKREPADPAPQWIGDTLRERGCHGRIDRIPPCREDLTTCLDCGCFGTDDHAVHG